MAVDDLDQVPLGLSGAVTVSRSRLSQAGAGRPRLLRTDEERLAWLQQRLDRQLDHPLIAPGSGAVARQVLSSFKSDPTLEFAKKLLLTLRDGQMHSTVAINSAPRIGLSFVAWRGSWQELIGKRYGRYFSSFFGTMNRVAEKAGPLAGFLEIDAFIEERVVVKDPLPNVEDCVTLNVEYTCFPHWPPDSDPPPHPDRPNIILFNRDLCSEDDKAVLARLTGRLDL